MGIRVGINGFGRIGRQVVRAAKQAGLRDIDFVAVNDISANLDPYTSLCRSDRERLERERETIRALRGRAREIRLALD